MQHFSYNERDYAFGRSMLSLRTTMRLTQADLAEKLDVSRKAIIRWESGESYPKASHLKALLTLALEKKAFAQGREEDEVRAFWDAAHQKVLLDEHWLQGLPGIRQPDLALVPSRLVEGSFLAAGFEPEQKPRADWGDAQSVSRFYGRQEELNELSAWIVQEGCRVVSVLGLGGIGKSALAVRLMHQVAPRFDVVIWRSLRDAPPCEVLLDDCLQVLAPQAVRAVSMSLERRLALLIDHLSRTRVLLVLDNLEALLEEGQSTGALRSGYVGYARLLRQVAEIEHQSCLLLTSREKPGDLVPLEGSRMPVRSVRLLRLDVEACQQLLAGKEVTGSAADYARLIEAYEGNPLALNIVAHTIVELFAGQIAPFLEQGEVIFGGIRDLLAQQVGRLSALEQTLLLWLAILREPVSLQQLLGLLVKPLSRAEVLEAMEALRRRSLVEGGHSPGSFTLQSVVLEYVTGWLINEAAGELVHRQLARLIEHGLELATAKEYVRQTQRRLLVVPLLARARRRYPGRVAVETALLVQLDELRAREVDAQGYGPANLLALLQELRGHLSQLDLSQLALRRAYLQGSEMHDTSLRGASLYETVFNEAFDIPWAVAISSTGRYWAAGSRRGEVRVWREGGTILHLAWQAHTDTVRALAFSPDGRTLGTGSWDGSIKMWDIERGNLLWTNWLADNIECVAFAPDGRTLASGGDDATIQLWNTQTGIHRQTLSGTTDGPIFALAWSPDGRLLAAGGVEGDIRLWQIQGAQPEALERRLSGHTNWVLGLAFAPDSSRLASASWDQTVKVWDVASQQVLQTLSGHSDRVRAVAWSPDGHLLASCGFDATIWLWESNREDARMGLHGHTAGVYNLAFTPDSRSLLSGSEDGTLRLWEVERGQCVHILQGYAVSLYDVAWSPDSTRLASVGSNTLVTIWDCEGASPPRVLSGHRSLVYGVAWSPDGRELASSGLDNAIRLWDAKTGELRQVLRDPDYANTLYYGIAWSPDGAQLASASYRRGVHMWEVTTGTRRWIGHGQLTRIRRVVWSPDGTKLASCGDNGSICVWEASNGQLQASFQGHQGMVMHVVWSPDGTKLAAAGEDGRGGGELSLWEAASGKRLHAWSEPSAVVYTLAWSPTGEMLLSGGSDGNIRCWDTRSGECVRVQQGHQAAIQSLKVSPDGQMLASCGDDNVIYIWDLQNFARIGMLRHSRPYERLDISEVKGLTQAQKASLRALGAIERML